MKWKELSDRIRKFFYDHLDDGLMIMAFLVFFIALIMCYVSVFFV